MPKHQSEQAFFVESHRQRLGELYAQHILSLGNIAVDHIDRISELRDVDDLERTVGIAPRVTGKTLTESEKAIAKALRVSHQDLLDILRSSDKGIFQSILMDSANRYVGPQEALARHIRGASDKEAAEAIRAGMDHVMYKALKNDAANRYVGPNEALRRHLGRASDDRVRSAMHAGVDEDVFKNLKNDAANRFVGPEEASRRHIRHVSHKKVAGKYTEFIQKKHGERPSASSRDRGFRTDRENQSLWDEELRRQAAESARRLREEEEGRKQQAEARRRPPIDRRVEEIIGRVADPGSHKTLLLEDPAKIARVINTVEMLRGKEPSITDREIYIRYRKKIEKHDADPALTRSFQILQNLMGGNISGKLPF